MGSSMSIGENKERRRSLAIDKQIEQDRTRSMYQVKVLVLGAQGSGKETMVRHMKTFHPQGFTSEELAGWRTIIHRNIMDAAKSVILTASKMGVEFSRENNWSQTARILEYNSHLNRSFHFEPEVVEALNSLWNDQTTSILKDRCSDPELIVSADYFYLHLSRITQDKYVPSEEDVLMARPDAMGITETTFDMGPILLRVVELHSQQPERKKWIHCFEGVTSIIFCAALSDYDQIIPEDEKQTKLKESMALFKSVVNSQWFRRTSIVLFLTKCDQFKAKLPKAPLEEFFPGYTGGSDVNKASKFILWNFMQENRATLTVYPHLIRETDTGNLRLLLAAVKETLLQNALRDTLGPPPSDAIVRKGLETSEVL